jgi:hypothetical protein
LHAYSETIMSAERPDDSKPTANRGGQSSEDPINSGASSRPGDPSHESGDSEHHETTTVLVRGETLHQDEQKPRQDAAGQDQDKSTRKEVSAEKVALQSRLPALGDDADVGVRKEHLVARDGKADLSFTGTLLASAAPSSAPQGRWQEYRIYETSAGKHVFSKTSRNILADQQDTHEADIFDPTPSTVPSKLLRSARDLAHSRPMTWMDAAVAFFGYDPLAKALYRKLSGQFEEHIS